MRDGAGQRRRTLLGFKISLVALVLTAVAAYTAQAGHPHTEPADLSN